MLLDWGLVVGWCGWKMVVCCDLVWLLNGGLVWFLNGGLVWLENSGLLVGRCGRRMVV